MKPYSEMTEDELIEEIGVWLRMVSLPKGPGTPSNDARDAASRMAAEAAAWLYRRTN